MLTRCLTLFRFLPMLIALNFLAACQQNVAASETPETQATSINKKLVSWGFDMPWPEFLRDNIRTMEQQPFDGVVFKLTKGPKDPLFDTRARTATDMKLDVLSQVAWQKFDSNFLLLGASNSTNMDWFNDSHWQTITTNLALYTRAVKAANAKGFVFDIETYDKTGSNPWRYRSKEGTALYSQSYLDVQKQVRKRGQQFMLAIQEEKPDITLLCAYLLGVAKHESEEYFPNAPERRNNALLPAFVDGMLDVMGPQVTMVDGRLAYLGLKGTYYFDEASKFPFHASYMRSAKSYVSPENQSKYSRQVQTGSTVFVDYLLGQMKGGYGSKVTANYDSWSQDYFHQWYTHNVYHALASTDQYVYVYSENHSWWGAEANPNYPTTFPHAKEGIITARAALSENKPLGYTMFKANSALWNNDVQATFVTSPTVTLQASSNKLTATVQGQTIRKVAFYQNARLISEDTTAPFEATPASSKGTFIAFAYDSSGRYNTSNVLFR